MQQQDFSELLESARKTQGDFVVVLIQSIIERASTQGISDLHFQPGKDGMEIWFRCDGVLHELGRIDSEYSNQIVARLKVLADLLTYRTTMPQEGRVQAGRLSAVTKQMRISTMPTLFGERVVLRFFAEEEKYQYPEQLGFSAAIQEDLVRTLDRKGGALMICGPAGSGKTTTAYALLRHLTTRGEGLRSIITLEDPVEHPIPRAAQVDVSEHGVTFSSVHQDIKGDKLLPAMIKYAMRQDPEVLFVGEIRDLPSAEAAFQAALTGHLLLTTFHAGSAVEAIGRLSELGLEPFVLRSSINQVICQRLLRRLCPHCAETSKEKGIRLTLNDQSFELEEYRLPVGCPFCAQTGYLGRTIVAESIPWNEPKLYRGVLDRLDTDFLQKIAREAGMKTIAESAAELVRQGITSPLEVQRVLGMRSEI